MKTKKHLAFLVFTILLLGIAYAQVPLASFEIVESIPFETSLDNPDIRNTQEVWLEMISNTRQTLDIEQFYISTQPGEPLEDIINEIKKAAERGVKVRIVAEKKFHKIYPEPLNSLGNMENIEVRIIDFGKVSKGGIQHSKFFIVDKSEVFVGSQNFDWRALKHIHEIGIHFKHEAAAKAFTDLFETDWQISIVEDRMDVRNNVVQGDYSIPYTISEKLDNPIQFFPVWGPAQLSPEEKLWSLKHILDLINKANSEINIELLNYSPIGYDKSYWPELDVVLRSAAARGVKVKMICADWSKSHPKIDHLKSLNIIPNIEIKLSTIPQYSKGFIDYARVTHAKFMVVDGDNSWVGCSNWSKDYFYNSRDAGVIVLNREVNRILKDIFDKDWESEYCYPIKPEVEYKPPRIR